MFFFFKQKTAYEMRITDWSSDVCSSDLIKVSLLPLDAVPRALAARDTRGLIKLIADKANDRLLGGQIMAPEGADSIQTLVLAIKPGMTTLELGAQIFPYLTPVEGITLADNPFDTDVAKLTCI